MNKLYLIYLLIFSNVLIFAQEKDFTEKTIDELEIKKLTNKIKSVKISTYNSLDNFGKITQGDLLNKAELYFNSNSKITSANFFFGSFSSDIAYRKYIIEYDSNGNTIEFYYYKKGQLKKKMIHTYERNNKKTKSVILRPKDNQFITTSTSTYEYNNDNQLIKINAYNPIDSTYSSLVTYYRNNKKHYTERLNNLGEKDDLFIIKFDEFGNIIKKKSPPDYLFTYKYDKKIMREFKMLVNNEIYHISYYSDLGDKTESVDFKNNSLNKKSLYAYNGQRDLIEEKKYNSQGNISESIHYKYKYDSLHNWIEQIKYVNGAVTAITERKIDYIK